MVDGGGRSWWMDGGRDRGGWLAGRGGRLALIPRRDDGAVTVAATALKGMTDHITLPATHSFLMNNPLVLYQVLWFLRQGAFARDVTLMDAVRALTQH